MSRESGIAFLFLMFCFSFVKLLGGWAVLSAVAAGIGLLAGVTYFILRSSKSILLENSQKSIRVKATLVNG